MATAEEKIQCPACGAMIRPKASFCYKCGEPVSQEGERKSVKVEGKKMAVSSAWFKDSLEKSVENKLLDEETESASSEQLADRHDVVSKVSEEPQRTKSEADLLQEIAVKNEQKRSEDKSAASLRRRPKFQRERVEMVWQQPEKTDSGWYVAATVFFLLFAAGLVIAAFFLK
jgi:cobalamin biosynthesis Mg chelatase CobN